MEKDRVFGFVQNSLREHTGDETLQVTEFVINPFQHDGASGHEVTGIEVSWKSNGLFHSQRLILKSWSASSWTSLVFLRDAPSEILAFREGIFSQSVLPTGFVVPYIGAKWDIQTEEAWLLMEDVSQQLRAYKAQSTKEEAIRNTQIVLDKLAHFHASWETREALARLAQYDWLLSQRTRLAGDKDIALALSGATAFKGDEINRATLFKQEYPQFFDSIATAIKTFLNSLSKSDRKTWEKCMNREPLIQAFQKYPKTLYHGDLVSKNIGVCSDGERSEAVLIDWEWMGIGAVTFDITKAINEGIERVIGEKADEDELLDYYLDRYKKYGGQRLDRRMLKEMYDLAFIFDALSFYCVFAGWQMQSEPNAHGLMVEKTKRATALMRKYLE